MKVGNNFLRMHGTILDPSHCWLITIGNNVTLAPRVHVLCHDASTCNSIGYARIGRVDIGNNVFVGAESVILPGVKIGDNVVIGANSTVTKDIPSGTVAVGSPARIVDSYDCFVERNRKLMEESPVYSEEYTLRKNIDKEKKEKMRKELSASLGFIK